MPLQQRAIPFGPFDLVAPVGRGGMGEVWRGFHREQRVPVAVKVLDRDRIGGGRFASAFRNEIHHVARLDHPHIVLVFDVGEISRDAEEASGGRLLAGSPYLAMEYASGGSLAAGVETLAWPDLRDLLLAVLDALAYAHARGVLHRDIKPGNVLLASFDDARPGVKLTDFGVAHAGRTARGAPPRSTRPREPVRRRDLPQHARGTAPVAWRTGGRSGGVPGGAGRLRPDRLPGPLGPAREPRPSPSRARRVRGGARPVLRGAGDAGAPRLPRHAGLLPRGAARVRGARRPLVGLGPPPTARQRCSPRPAWRTATWRGLPSGRARWRRGRASRTAPGRRGGSPPASGARSGTQKPPPGRRPTPRPGTRAVEAGLRGR